MEAERYSALFANLAEYPLSEDQIEAVLRDEDNNLVVAGAGTGKTTTISAKVAYLWNKGLARPDELLIIPFTRNAANEMNARILQHSARPLFTPLALKSQWAGFAHRKNPLRYFMAYIILMVFSVSCVERPPFSFSPYNASPKLL